MVETDPHEFIPSTVDGHLAGFPLGAMTLLANPQMTWADGMESHHSD